MSITIPSDDVEIKPTLPDRRYDSEKPINYSVGGGLQYIDSALVEFEDSLVDLDLDPYEETEGYYSESGGYYLDHPEVMASLHKEYRAAVQAVESAFVRCDVGKPVEASFSAVTPFSEFMPREIQVQAAAAVNAGTFTSEEWGDFLTVHLPRAARKAFRDMRSAQGESDFQGQLSQAVLAAEGDNWSLLTRLLEGEYSPASADLQVLDDPQKNAPRTTTTASRPTAGQQRLAKVARLYGPRSPFYRGPSLLLRKVKAWVLSYEKRATSEKDEVLSWLKDLIKKAKPGLKRETSEQPKIERLVAQMEEFVDVVGIMQDPEVNWAKVQEQVYRFQERAKVLGLFQSQP